MKTRLRNYMRKSTCAELYRSCSASDCQSRNASSTAVITIFLQRLVLRRRGREIANHRQSDRDEMR
jgi:hypothetical protein